MSGVPRHAAPSWSRRALEMVAVAVALLALREGMAWATAGREPLEVRVAPGASARERRAAAEEAALYREASRSSWLPRDAFVRERLLANRRAAGIEEEAPSDAEGWARFFREAKESEHLARDPLLRAHVVRRMRARLGFRLHMPTHPPSPEPAMRVRYTSVFLGAAPPEGEIVAARAALDGGADPGSISVPLLEHRVHAESTPERVALRYGRVFEAALRDGPLGVFGEPLRGHYGVHLLRVDARRMVVETARPTTRGERQLTNELAQVRLDALMARFDVAFVETGTR